MSTASSVQSTTSNSQTCSTAEDGGKLTARWAADLGLRLLHALPCSAARHGHRGSRLVSAVAHRVCVVRAVALVVRVHARRASSWIRIIAYSMC